MRTESTTPSGDRRERAAPARALAAARALPARIAGDRVLAALTVLLGVGLALRVWMTLVWSPAITGYSDSGIYFQDSVQSIWRDPIRTQGYTMFLRVLHAITPHLLFVTIVQHALGLVGAVIIFLAVRRLGGPRWLGLIPAAVVALAGDELFIEHAALSDALLIFLLIVTLYSAIRTLDGGLRWAALTGVLIGLGVWERGASLAFAGIVPLWLLFSAGRPTRRSLALAMVALVVSLGDRRRLHRLAQGRLWPAGPAVLEQRVEPLREGGTVGGLLEVHATCGHGHIVRRDAGLPARLPQRRRSLHLQPQLACAAVLRPALQRLDVPARDGTAAEMVGGGDSRPAARLPTRRVAGHDPAVQSQCSLVQRHVGGRTDALVPPGSRPGPPPKNEFVEYWQHILYPHDPPPTRGDITPFVEWEEFTRLDGVLMGVLLALSLAGPWLLGARARALAPRARSGMVLFGVSALAMLFFPILVKGYDYRFVIPAYPPLVAAATLAGWGLAVRVGPFARRLRGRASRTPGVPGTPGAPVSAGPVGSAPAANGLGAAALTGEPGDPTSATGGQGPEAP